MHSGSTYHAVLVLDGWIWVDGLLAGWLAGTCMVGGLLAKYSRLFLQKQQCARGMSKNSGASHD